jgi:hypothetical protein
MFDRTLVTFDWGRECLQMELLAMEMKQRDAMWRAALASGAQKV